MEGVAREGGHDTAIGLGLVDDDYQFELFCRFANYLTLRSTIPIKAFRYRSTWFAVHRLRSFRKPHVDPVFSIICCFTSPHWVLVCFR